jgi:hypothetical protein
VPRVEQPDLGGEGAPRSPVNEEEKLDSIARGDRATARTVRARLVPKQRGSGEAARPINAPCPPMPPMTPAVAGPPR